VEPTGGFGWRSGRLFGHPTYTSSATSSGMYWLLQFGPLGSPPALLVALVVLAAIVLVGRVVLAFAWRLVLVALVVAAALWVLAGLGFETGVF